MSITHEKISNPTKFYHNPKEVKEDGSLTKKEKVTLLINWLDDERLRAIATEENMRPTGSAESSDVLCIEQLLEYYQTH